MSFQNLKLIIKKQESFAFIKRKSLLFMRVREGSFFFLLLFCGAMHIWTSSPLSYTFMAGYKQNWSTVTSTDTESYAEHQTLEED